MRIKGWKKLGDWTGKTVKTPEHIIYQSYGPRPAEISVKRVYMKDTNIPLYWEVRIWKREKIKPFLEKTFERKKEAFSFAVKWMRKHPNE